MRSHFAGGESQSAYTEYLAANGGKAPDFIAGSSASPEQAPATWTELSSNERNALVFVHPGSGATYAVAEELADWGCDGYRGYALGFFKTGTANWLDLTGDGTPYNRFPGRPMFEMMPLAAVALGPGSRIFMIAPEGIYADTGSGFVPVLTTGRVRTTCFC